MNALNLRGYETRNESIIRLVALAEQERSLPSFGPVLVHTGDQPVNRGDQRWRALSFSTAEGFSDVPVPDFLFDGWPQVGLGDYEQACETAAQGCAAPAELTRAGWIGNCDTNPVRWQVHALGAAHPEMLDVIHVSWVPAGDGTLTTAARNEMTLAEQIARWSLPLGIEGRGWSARLKLLLHSGRPVLVQDRPWHEWFWPQLQAEQPLPDCGPAHWRPVLDPVLQQLGALPG